MAVERLRDAKQQQAADGTSQSILGEYGALVNGQWLKTGTAIEVRSPYDNSLVATVHRAGPDEVEQAIQAAHDGFKTIRKIPTWQRAEILEKVSQAIKDHEDDFVKAMALEAGKPLSAARAEVARASFTFKVAAEESKRIYGEIVQLDWMPGRENRVAQIHRVPRGPVVGISPFNYPLNLVAHKVAPAIAAGCPIIIRPASQTPINAFLLADLVLEAGWPAAGIQVFSTATRDATPLVEDDRIKKLTFTGSPAVGWDLKARAGMKPVTLELGGNAGTIIHHDADLEYASTRVAAGGYSYAGQSCISVQRVYLHEDIAEEFTKMLVAKVDALVAGDPMDEATDVGPVIDTGSADRIGLWLDEAKEGGAEILSGGTREGNVWRPTLLTNVEEAMNVSCQEVFGPLVSLFTYTDVNEAIRRVDDSDYGLQAGLFTHDRRIIERAFDEIEVGGLMVNEVSAWRVDHMPYGGAKASGFGREGLRYAIEEMTEMKLLTYNNNF